MTQNNNSWRKTYFTLLAGQAISFISSGILQMAIICITTRNFWRVVNQKMGGSESLQLELFDDAEKNKNPPSNQNNISNEWQKTQILIKNDRNLVMPSHHEIRAEDVDLKRLGAVLATAYESENTDFESLLLTPGLGPRTLQSLTLVSEVIYGTPSRFTDPARFRYNDPQFLEGRQPKCKLTHIVDVEKLEIIIKNSEKQTF